MKIILIGGSGQVGSAIHQLAVTKGFELKPLSRSQLDLANDIGHLSEIIKSFLPSVLINAAAYTNVDGAESNERAAFAVNADAISNLSDICKKFDLPLIHFSTDYVFDGTKRQSYHEEDITCPINTYGRSKLVGEENIRNRWEKHIIIRTSWVFSELEPNFILKILSLMDRPTLQVVNDQFGGPTSADSIARFVLDLLPKISSFNAADWGVYHFAGQPFVTWFDLADRVFNLVREININLEVPKIIPCASSEFNAIAKRPANSRLVSARDKVVAPEWEGDLKQIIMKKFGHLNLG